MQGSADVPPKLKKRCAKGAEEAGAEGARAAGGPPLSLMAKSFIGVQGFCY